MQRMFTNTFTRDEEESWWDRARDERNGVVIPPPDSSAPVHSQTKHAHTLVSTKPAQENPTTGKVYRPGERLERQARKFAQSHAVQPRKRRDYDALIARALEDLSDHS